MSRILVVEDERKIARFLELELRHEGYDVETWKIWKRNGVKVKEELFVKSKYKTYQETVEYNDGSQP